MTELWNWRIDGDVVRVEVYQALAEALGRPVMPLGGAEPARVPAEAVVCDVWRRPGEFALSSTATGAARRLAEHTAIAALARRLGRNCLMRRRHPRRQPAPAGRPGRHGPRGALRRARTPTTGRCSVQPAAVHPGHPGCRGWSQCHRSRWAPDSVLPGARRGLTPRQPVGGAGPASRVGRWPAPPAGRAGWRWPRSPRPPPRRTRRRCAPPALRKPRDLPDVLQRRRLGCRSSVTIRDVRLAQGLDAPAHGCSSFVGGSADPDTLSLVMTTAAAGSPRTYQVRTYGCQMNVHDSERISGLLEEAGYVRAAEADERPTSSSSTPARSGRTPTTGSTATSATCAR